MQCDQFGWGSPDLGRDATSLGFRGRKWVGGGQDQLEKLEAARSAFLLLPFVIFPGLTRPYWALLCFTWPYLALHGLNGPYWALHGLTGPYWILLGHTAPYWATGPY